MYQEELGCYLRVINVQCSDPIFYLRDEPRCPLSFASRELEISLKSPPQFPSRRIHRSSEESGHLVENFPVFVIEHTVCLEEMGIHVTQPLPEKDIGVACDDKVATHA